jgi:hypothetical protein
MKSQDIFLLLKLICIHKREKGMQPSFGVEEWKDWEEQYDIHDDIQYGKSIEESIVDGYSVRALARETGISKSQVNLILQRCFDVGLAKRDRHLGVPRANTTALINLIIYGVPYIFPAKLGTVARGIATSLAAPVLEGKLFSAGELPPIWPDAQGKTKGLSIEPLYISVPYAVKRDPDLYALLALVDSIRIGHARERNMAIELLKVQIEQWSA